MATQRQIETATHTTKAPVGTKDDYRAQTVLYIPQAQREAEERERTDAAVFARRLANRHDCPGLCDHPGHQDDVTAALTVLQALGLKADPPQVKKKPASRGKRDGRAPCPECGRMQYLRATGVIGGHQHNGSTCPGAGQPPRKQCTHCWKSKPLSEFYADQASGDGLNSWCKTCNNTNRKKRGHAA